MVEFNRNHNAKVRAAAFQWLSGLVSIHEIPFLVPFSRRVSNLTDNGCILSALRESSNPP